jgi:NAD-dependent DNA ligase
VVGKNIKAFVKENKDFIKELASVVVIKEVKVEKVKVGAKKVCCTGFRPHSPEELAIIEKNGDVVVDSVNKDTQLLVVKDILKTSSKTKAAIKLNIEVRSYEQYFKV